MLFYPHAQETTQLEEWQQQVINLFPGENPRNYYYPYKKINGCKVNPEGRFYDHFHYIKRTSYKEGLIRASNVTQYKNQEVVPYELTGKFNNCISNQRVTDYFIWCSDND